MSTIALSWQLKELSNLYILNEYPQELIEKVFSYVKIAEELNEKKFQEKKFNLKDEDLVLDKDFMAIIEEWTKSCQIQDLYNIREETPRGHQEIMFLPSLNPKLALYLIKSLSVNSISELWQAGKDRKIQKLPDMEAKTERTIKREIICMRNARDIVSIDIASKVSSAIKEEIMKIKDISRVEFAGELRRNKAGIKDVDLIVESEDIESSIKIIKKHPRLKTIHTIDDYMLSATLRSGLKMNIHFTSASNFKKNWWEKTGSSKHISQLQSIIKNKGVDIDDMFINESRLYEELTSSYIEPELREGNGEIKAALNEVLPELVNKEDIRGDLHMHTTYSDGLNTLREMILACKQRGYDFMAVCDHSRSLTIADGLSVEELGEQGEEIVRLKKELDFPVLRGIEADILLDGTLDYEDEVLAEMDLVIASIHSGFSQNEEEITNRLIKSAYNPHVDIIAHPTGRILGYRDPYPVDMDAVIKACSKTGTILEINSAPERLDLNEILAKQAKDLQVKIAINTDAHSCEQLSLIKYGVNQAKRAWLSSEDIVNCWSLERLLRYIE